MQTMDDTRPFLDITQEICPMTFVKARRLIDALSSGQEAVLRISGGEPLENLPRSIKELGHAVLAIMAEGQYYHLHIKLS